MGVLSLSSFPTISPLLPPPSPSRRSRIPTLTPPSPLFLPLLRSIHPTSPSIAAPISPTTSTKPQGAARQPPEHVYPDPIPEFATAETHRFRSELLKRLSKNRETFGDDIDAVVQVCAQRFSDFLHEEYGGPGTLLVEPFTDMLLALKEKKLPGAPVAARAALLWAQNYVDEDWEIWTSRPSK